MAQPTNKQSLIDLAQEGYTQLMQALSNAGTPALETAFIPKESKAKCTTFAQGENMRDVLTHIYEWQRLQAAFVANIRKDEPKDFIPDPYRKNYKEMDEVNRLKHQTTSIQQAIALLQESHPEMISLIESFTEEELFGKKVFKVTYTTTMAAYFASVTTSPYSQALKRLKSHINSLKKK